jgi:hypothetical protein
MAATTTQQRGTLPSTHATQVRPSEARTVVRSSNLLSVTHQRGTLIGSAGTVDVLVGLDCM